MNALQIRILLELAREPDVGKTIQFLSTELGENHGNLRRAIGAMCRRHLFKSEGHVYSEKPEGAELFFLTDTGLACATEYRIAQDVAKGEPDPEPALIRPYPPPYRPIELNPVVRQPLTLRELQTNLPWTIRYSRDFRSNPQPHKDFAHGVTHAGKALGRLHELIDDMDHRRTVADGPETREQYGKYVADLVICALRMANTFPGGPIDLQRITEDRIEDKNGVRLPRQDIIDEKALGTCVAGVPKLKFSVGDPIRKPKGYAFDGEIRAVFTKKDGTVRVVAENADTMLHIFSEANLEPAPESELGCKARQYSDSMWCRHCDLIWDMNDPTPPPCKAKSQAD